MKRLLLNSSNIKPVNIRIVSNGVQCADLKMLKENFCISDIKDVLDGRLVNWLNNIGEKELAQKVMDNFPTPDSVIGKEFTFCQLISNFNNIKEYAQILGKGTDLQLIRKEIKHIPRLTVELYSLYPNKYTSLEWIDLFESSCECEESKLMMLNIKKKIEEEQEERRYLEVHRKQKKEEDERNEFRDFLVFSIDYCKRNNVYQIHKDVKARQELYDYLNKHVTNEVYKQCGKNIIEHNSYADIGGRISIELGECKGMETFNGENFKPFLCSLLEITEIPYAWSVLTQKYYLTTMYSTYAYTLFEEIRDLWPAITLEEKRRKINDFLNKNNLSQFCL